MTQLLLDLRIACWLEIDDEVDQKPAPSLVLATIEIANYRLFEVVERHGSKARNDR